MTVRVIPSNQNKGKVILVGPASRPDPATSGDSTATSACNLSGHPVTSDLSHATLYDGVVNDEAKPEGTRSPPYSEEQSSDESSTSSDEERPYYFSHCAT